MKNLVLVFIGLFLLIFTSSFFIEDIKSNSYVESTKTDYVITYSGDTLYGKIKLGDPPGFKANGTKKYKSITVSDYFAYYKEKGDLVQYYESIYVKRNQVRPKKYKSDTSVYLYPKFCEKYINGYYSIYHLDYSERNANSELYYSGHYAYAYNIGDNTKKNYARLLYHLDLLDSKKSKKKNKALEEINRAFSNEKEFLNKFNNSNQTLGDFFVILMKLNTNRK